MTGTGKPVLGPLDVERERLKACYPGWNIWYVPNALDGSVTWCAQPLPLLNCGSREELARAIEASGADGRLWYFVHVLAMAARRA